MNQFIQGVANSGIRTEMQAFLGVQDRRFLSVQVPTLPSASTGLEDLDIEIGDLGLYKTDSLSVVHVERKRKTVLSFALESAGNIHWHIWEVVKRPGDRLGSQIDVPQITVQIAPIGDLVACVVRQVSARSAGVNLVVGIDRVIH